MVESTSKLRALVKGFTGFDIMEDEKTFKSIYEIILGIGEKWQDLNDIDKAALLEALAGKRAGNALAAALNNVDDLKAAYETALNSSGSAMKEQENYEKSIQFSIDRLKATAQDLANDFMSSDLVKGAIDFLNNVLELLDGIVEKTGSLVPLVTALGGAFAAIKLGSGISEFTTLLGGLLGKSTNKKGGIKEFLSKSVFGKAVKNVKEVGETAATTATEVDEMFDIMSVANGAATYSEAMGGIATTTEAAGTAAAGATISMGALLAIVAAIGIAVYAGVKAWDYYTTTVEETEQQIEETKGKIEELQSEIDALNSKDDRNEYENNKLAILKEELAVQKDLLDIEQRRRLSEKYGTKFSDSFDEDNQNTKIRKNKTGQDSSDKFFGLSIVGALIANIISKDSEQFYKNAVGKQDNLSVTISKAIYDGINKLLGSKSSTIQDYKNKKIAYENINNSIKEERSKLDTKNKSNPENQKVLDRIHKLEKRQGELKQELDMSILDVQEMFSNAILERDQIKQDIDSGLLTGKDLETAKNNLQYYENLIDELNQLLVKEKKESGNYDFFETYDFSVAINNDEEALKELINSEKDNSQLLSKLKSQYPDLIALMDREGVTLDELIKKYREYSEVQKESSPKSVKFNKAGMIDAITDLSDGFDKLDEIYADVYDKGSFDFTKLSTKKFEEAFKGLEEEYTEFIETVSANPNDLEATQSAFNKLVGAYINNSGVLKGLNKDNKELTANMLKNMGVANAEALVEEALADKEMEREFSEKLLAKSSKDVTEANLEEIDSLIKEGKYTDEAKNKIYAYALEKRFASGINIRNNDDLDFLTQMAYLAGVASEAIEGLEKARAAYAGIKDRVNHSITYSDGSSIAIEYDKDSFRQGVEKESQKVLDQIKEKLNATYTPEVQYAGADKTKSAIDKANKSGEESKEIFDWIEKALQRQEEEINRIDKVVNATYKNWSKRNSSLLSEITEINKEIAMQRTAYQAYMHDAEAIPLSEEYKKLVREGAMKSEIISDKTLKKNIKEYEELYDKAIKAKDAVADLESKIAALAKAKFDNVKSEFEGFTSEIEHFVNMIDKELSHVENMEKIAGKSFYNAKMDQDEKRLEELNKERTALVQALRDAEANGVETGSADWIAMRNDIYSVDEAIADLTYELEDLKKKLKEVAKLNFDDLKNQFENAIGIITGQIDLTDAVVSMTQNAGYIASREYYKALIEGSKENVTALRKEYTRLSDELTKAMSSGDIEKYDKQW